MDSNVKKVNKAGGRRGKEISDSVSGPRSSVTTTSGRREGGGEGRLVRSESQTLWKKIFTLTIVGKDGTGKKSTANTILGRKEFVVSSRRQKTSSLLSQKCETSFGIVQAHVCAGPIGRADLPILRRALDNQPDAILLVIRLGLYDSEDHEVFRMLKELGGDDIFPYLVVVFTGGDVLLSEDDVMTGAPKNLRHVIHKCDNRFVIFNNKGKNKLSQAEDLLELVEKMMKENDGGYLSRRQARGIWQSPKVDSSKGIWQNAANKSKAGKTDPKPRSSAAGYDKQRSSLSKDRFRRSEDEDQTETEQSEEVDSDDCQSDGTSDSPSTTDEEDEEKEARQSTTLTHRSAARKNTQTSALKGKKRREDDRREKYADVPDVKNDDDEEEDEEFPQETKRARSSTPRRHTETTTYRAEDRPDYRENNDRRRQNENRRKMHTEDKERETAGSRRPNPQQFKERADEAGYDDIPRSQFGFTPQTKPPASRDRADTHQSRQHVRTRLPESSSPSRGEHFTFLLLGKTGSGKSSTGNTLLGGKLFHCSGSFSSVTAECELKEAVVNNVHMEIMDSPGLCDTGKSDADISVIITKTVVGLHPGPHALLYVLKAERFTEEEYEVFKKLEKLFDERLFEYLIVIFTGGDNFEYDGTCVEDAIKAAPPTLTELLGKCSNRYIVFNNRAADPKPQVDRFLHTVRRMVRANGKRPHYRCPKYDCLGEELEKEVRNRIAGVEAEMLQKQQAYKDSMAQQEQAMEKKLEEQRKEFDRKIAAKEMSEAEANKKLKEIEEKNLAEKRRLEKELEDMENKNRIELRAKELAAEKVVKQETVEGRGLVSKVKDGAKQVAAGLINMAAAPLEKIASWF